MNSLMISGKWVDLNAKFADLPNINSEGVSLILNKTSAKMQATTI